MTFRHACRSRLAAVLTVIGIAATTLPETGHVAAQEADGDEPQRHSPWLLVPLVSSSPKLGTSFGGMAGYIMKFDEHSSPSLIGLKATTSNTSSTVVAGGGKLFFHADRDRLAFGLVGGKVTNDYLDFLGSGQEVRSDENLRAYFVRYQHAVTAHWYLGVQAVYSNYGVEGDDPTSQMALEEAGLTGIVSSGPGLVLAYDTRDNVNNPTSGMYAQIHNFAYRESFGSDDDYDAINADWRWYLRTGPKNVLVLHAKGRWTDDAPPSRESSIEMRGYTHGQYLGRNSLTLESEDRYTIRPRWGAKVFGGVACLYGDGKSCGGDQVYPMLGVGAFYIIKPQEHMVVNAEFAKGEGDNQGFYLRFGNQF
ncbi:MAG TPA: BamA/TamA family outer membrane protein [Povalibacter sp.]|uniref:BamA/TamA family outer membrane protein n=1 Tax=Povalibacter sp. TaxID=1962978 RepID=UPI002C293355|nr:BamA/TamA family outer membrane protein [Povalibacter sp.]HMN43908.1 BamA/TamA family outer membrane protein [Povalibacter sp.]